MAQATLSLVSALRETADRLASGVRYQWSHFASCNCGNLAQTVTQLTPAEIYEAAFRRGGDWGEQAREFCPESGYPIDFIFDRMFALGMTREDVRHLERLSDDRVLEAMGRPALRHTHRPDVIAYMRAWANLLESQLLESERSPAFACAAE